MIDREGPDDFIPSSWREDVDDMGALRHITRSGSNNCSRNAIEIRE